MSKKRKRAAAARRRAFDLRAGIVTNWKHGRLVCDGAVGRKLDAPRCKDVIPAIGASVEEKVWGRYTAALPLRRFPEVGGALIFACRALFRM